MPQAERRKAESEFYHLTSIVCHFPFDVVSCLQDYTMKLCLCAAILLILSTIPIQIASQMVALTPSEPKEPSNKLSEEKTSAHVKIASAHLSESENSKEDVPQKITQKEKLLELQNPAKHASETQLLQFLLHQFVQATTDPESKVEILQNLENFSHKFENGRDLFKSTDAINTVLIPALNSSYGPVRSAACGVIAIASQNNIEVQNNVLEFGMIRRLIHLLQYDDEFSVSGKALFALSSVLRNFPEGQQQFVLDGGIPALVKVAFNSHTRKRAITLVFDLLREIKQCEENEDCNANINGASVAVILKSAGWCDVLKDCVGNLNKFDLQDQILTAESVEASAHFCDFEVFESKRGFEEVLERIRGNEDFIDEIEILKRVIAILSESRKVEL